MTEQEAYDTIKKHLLTQKAKASDGQGLCFYRHAGLKCAIGALIPDDIYKPEMETEGLQRLNEDMNWGLPFQFLIRLRLLHDTQDVDRWEDRLKEIALSYGLNP